MKKVWNPLYIGVISYFCLVLPAVILWGINFRKLGKPNLTWPTFLVGGLLFLLLVLGWIFLPQSWDWALEAFHIILSIAGASFQYSYFHKFLEADEENHQRESLLKPALLSILFVLTVVSLFIGWNWYLQHQTEQELLLAKEKYDIGDYPASVKILNSIIEEDPGQRTAYMNLSIAYETMGKSDSAIYVLDNWLIQMPEDSEVKDRIYQLRYMNSGR